MCILTEVFLYTYIISLGMDRETKKLLIMIPTGIIYLTVLSPHIFNSNCFSQKKSPKSTCPNHTLRRKSLNLHSRDVADPVMCSRIQTANYQ